MFKEFLLGSGVIGSRNNFMVWNRQKPSTQYKNNDFHILGFEQYITVMDEIILAIK